MGYYEGQRAGPCPRCGGIVATLFISVSPMTFSQRCRGCGTTDYTPDEDRAMSGNGPTIQEPKEDPMNPNLTTAQPSTTISLALPPEADEALREARAVEENPMERRWYLGSMNDGLFIIDKKPTSGTDVPPGIYASDPDLVLNVVALTEAQAQAIVDAHNEALAAASPSPETER